MIQKILGYENYEVDMTDFNDVKVYSLNYRNTGRRHLLKPGKSDGIHKQVVLSKDNVKTTLGLHQIVWRQFNGEIPKGYDVHHIDFDPDNNNPENMQLLTRSEHLKIHSKLQNKKGLFGKVAKKVLQFDYQCNLIKEWESGKQAKNEYGPAVEDCLLHRNRSKSAYGYVWIFEDEYIKSK